ncbi:hypothetical protein O3P69_007644 [Scylla paramamosain]|uniref:Uncharacterized protein n=1 Tax=Scylla paramamosain TaxID=85552 RepID=A0AAW0UYA3_SCYPA
MHLKNSHLRKEFETSVLYKSPDPLPGPLTQRLAIHASTHTNRQMQSTPYSFIRPSTRTHNHRAPHPPPRYAFLRPPSGVLVPFGALKVPA